jgi:PASTA domain
MRYTLLAILALLPAAAGCGGETTPASDAPVRPRVVPYVTGMRLDEAKRELARRHLVARVHDEGFGDVVVESSWTVCDQWPYEGERARSVDLYVEHFCDEEEYEDDDDF